MVRRKQNLGFIPDWERVDTPLVDYLLNNKSHIVDLSRPARAVWVLFWRLPGCPGGCI